MPSLAAMRLAKASAARAAQTDSNKTSNIVELPLWIRARSDYFAYAEYLGKPVPDHIRPWIKEIITEKSNGRLLRVAGPNLNILAPRGSAKSVFIGMLASWLIGIHTAAKKPFYILYISYNQKLANLKSKTIRNIVSSEIYRKVFPEVRINPSERSESKWSIDYAAAGINVIGDTAITVAAAGLDSSITGFRAHMALGDDLIKSAKSIANPEIREELVQNWRQTMKPILYEGARAIDVGTRFHFNDIHATEFIPQMGWKVLTQPALLYDPETRKYTSYWPKISDEAYGFSVEFLLDLRAKDPIGFSYQFQQEAILTGDLTLDPGLIRRAIIPDEFDDHCIAIDLSATANERSDFTAMVYGGRADKTMYAVDARQCRSLGNLDKIRLLLEMLVEWDLIIPDGESYISTDKIVVVAVETNAYQASILDDFREILFNKYFLENLVILPITRNRGDKLSHFRGITGMFGTVEKPGVVVFNAFQKFTELLNQILNPGATDKDDLLDAFVMCMSTLRKRAGFAVEFW